MVRLAKAIDTLACLVMARVLVGCVPFRWIAARLGTQGQESVVEVPPADLRRAREVAFYIRGVCRRLRWSPSCLVRATAAMVLLRRRHLEGTLYVGVASDQKEGIRAHAWVRCGAVFVTGGRERRAYAVIGRFSRAPGAQGG